MPSLKLQFSKGMVAMEEKGAKESKIFFGHWVGRSKRSKRENLGLYKIKQT